MNVKSEKTYFKKASEFPKLMEGANKIVLFCRESEGVVVYSEDANLKIGYHTSIWDMSKFTDFNGSVTISSGD